MKKRFVSMLLALTLVVSGMPVGITAEGVHAAEISESEVVAETEETQDAVEDKDAYKEELHSEAGDLYAFNVSADGKAVGSDGVVYDDVAYLSADTVKSFGSEDQSTYVEICDRIAEEKNAGDYLQNVVIAVDEDGNLLVQREASMELFRTMLEERAENFFENETQEDEVVGEDEETEELLTEKNAEDIEIDDSSAEDGVSKEVSDAENESKEVDTEEVSETETSVEDSIAENEKPSTGEIMTDNDAEDDALAEASMAGEEELSTEEDMTDDAIVEESETAEEEFVPSAENMELICEPEMETFEIVENAKADVILDLGYNKTGDTLQFNSILPTEDWFSKQLSSKQKVIYNASKVLGKGKNQFTIAPSSVPESEDILQAVSAYIITEPYKCDWIDLTEDVKMVDTFLVGGGSKKYEKTTITFGKSKYYTPEIQKEANAKVAQIAGEAQEYALKYYPAFPVYGIVEYYDKWICENNYYNMVGIDGGSSINPAEQEAYYYCHSSYGVLLKGYGVCESYALAMTRLLDAIGIPNMYATGIGNGGGHAWNYIEMPDGKWYLQDSTWNEIDTTADKVDSASTQYYLLCGDDANQADGKGHIPWGIRYTGLKPFEFVDRSPSYYQPPKDGEIIFSKKIINLEPKQKETLTCNNAYTEDENVPKVWISSNEKVAKVDQKGNVTAVAPGMAEITYVVSGISDSCIVVVSQINSLTFNDGGKASLTTSGSIFEGKGEEQQVSLTVNQKVPVFTAEELRIEEIDHTGEYAEILNAAEILQDVEVKPSDPSVVTVTHTLIGDTIDLKITPLKVGKTKIVVTFGAKKATLNYSVGEKLDENWFKLDEVKKLEDESKAGTLMYTGKAYKPKVELSDEGKAKKVKFKVSYLNNKDAGTASVVITGTGTYGGEIRRTFTIKPLTLNVDTGSVKIKESNLYNGGVNQTKSTIKHLNGTKKVGLKAGKDYDIEYTNGEIKTTEPKEVGTYTMKVVGKGNYTGEASISGTYEIKPTELKKVKVAVKVNGSVPIVTVAIGKNPLSKTDYKITYYTDKNCEDQTNGSVFMKKTQYYVKVEAAGLNIIQGTKGKPIVKSFKTK